MTKSTGAGCSLLTEAADQVWKGSNKLGDALSAISELDRELILMYYTGIGRCKINNRQILARRLGIELNTYDCEHTASEG